MLNKAFFLTSLDRQQEAKLLLEKVLCSAEPQLSPLDPFTLRVIHNLSFACHSLGEYTEAESPCELAIAGRERTRGLNDNLTLSSIEQLGLIYHKQGLQSLAMEKLEIALAGYKALSVDSWEISVYRTLHYLGQVHVSQNDPCVPKVVSRRRLLATTSC